MTGYREDMEIGVNYKNPLYFNLWVITSFFETGRTYFIRENGFYVLAFELLARVVTLLKLKVIVVSRIESAIWHNRSIAGLERGTAKMYLAGLHSPGENEF